MTWLYLEIIIVELLGRFCQRVHLHRNDVLSDRLLVDCSLKMRTVHVFLLFKAAQISCVRIDLY